MSQKRKALGKGLSALITEEFEKIDENAIMMIPIDHIQPNPMQPRKTMNGDKIEELADSIRKHGLIQPIIVKKIESIYQIIAGERRWRASKIAGLKQMPALVRDVSNRTQEEMALVENIQREDLNAMEEARAYQVIMDRYAITHEELSEVVGKSRVYVTNLLRLLKLPDYIQEAVAEGLLTQGHGKVLVGLEDKEAEEIYQHIVSEELSVRETEKYVKAYKERAKKSKAKPRKKSKPHYLVHIEEVLGEEYGTKVEVQQGKKSGKLVMHFGDDNELSRLIQILSQSFND